jgi:hypothetical protein
MNRVRNSMSARNREVGTVGEVCDASDGESMQIGLISTARYDIRLIEAVGEGDATELIDARTNEPLTRWDNDDAEELVEELRNTPLNESATITTIVGDLQVWGFDLIYLIWRMENNA